MESFFYRATDSFGLELTFITKDFADVVVWSFIVRIEDDFLNAVLNFASISLRFFWTLSSTLRDEVGSRCVFQSMDDGTR